MGKKRTSIVWSIGKAELEKVVAESYTYANILRYFGINPFAGSGNFKTLRKRLDEEKIDYSHIKTATGSQKYNPKSNSGKGRPITEYLVKGSNIQSTRLKSKILREGILENKCSECGQDPWWNGKPLVLQLDHINGDKYDNRLENLRILCGHCHSQTSTFCGKNGRDQRAEKNLDKTKSFFISDMKTLVDSNLEKKTRVEKELKIIEKTIEKIKCQLCEKEFIKTSSSGKYCSRECVGLSQRKAERPSKEELDELINSMSMVAVGKKFGVSDSSIRKWCKDLGVDLPDRRAKKYKIQCCACPVEYEVLERDIRSRARRSHKGPYCSDSCTMKHRNEQWAGLPDKSRYYEDIAKELGIEI